MKIAIECDCILLQESLRIFLEKFYVPKKDCDFVIADKKMLCDKPVFLIGENSPYLKIPFTKENLISTLEEFYSAIQIDGTKITQNHQNYNFEEKISNLVDKFKSDLINLIKSEYEK